MARRKPRKNNTLAAYVLGTGTLIGTALAAGCVTSQKEQTLLEESSFPLMTHSIEPLIPGDVEVNYAQRYTPLMFLDFIDGGEDWEMLVSAPFPQERLMPEYHKMIQQHKIPFDVYATPNFFQQLNFSYKRKSNLWNTVSTYLGLNKPSEIKIKQFDRETPESEFPRYSRIIPGKKGMVPRK